MKAPHTTRPPQADTSFAPLADLSLQAKRKAVRPGTAEFCVESSFLRNVLVQVLRGMLCLNVLSFGDFSLHEQRKVTRAASGRAEALLWSTTWPHSVSISADRRMRGSRDRQPISAPTSCNRTRSSSTRISKAVRNPYPAAFRIRPPLRPPVRCARTAHSRLRLARGPSPRRIAPRQRRICLDGADLASLCGRRRSLGALRCRRWPFLEFGSRATSRWRRASAESFALRVRSHSLPPS